LEDDSFEIGGVRLLQNVKKVLPEQRLASSKTQGADAGSTYLVHEFNRAIRVDPVVPSRLPVITADASSLTIFS
jgi:hypothetical protein